MLTLPPSVHVHLAVEPIDLRKSFDALAAVVRQQFGQEPMSGHLFVFRSRRGRLLKILLKAPPEAPAPLPAPVKSAEQRPAA